MTLLDYKSLNFTHKVTEPDLIGVAMFPDARLTANYLSNLVGHQNRANGGIATCLPNNKQQLLMTIGI